MGELFQLRKKLTPEMEAAFIQELADLDERREVLVKLLGSRAIHEEEA